MTPQSETPYTERLLEAIGSVHSVESFTTFDIDVKPLPNDWTGQFDPYTRTATVSPESRFPLTTGVHEVGHAIDALFLVAASKLGRLDSPITLYASQYAADGKGMLVAWYQAMKRTQHLKDLLEVLRRFPFMTSEWDEVQYFLRPAEIWARAYEQFIALNTTDKDLKMEFTQKYLEEARVGYRRFKVYWTHEDFQTIHSEMKRVFEALGWK